MRINKLSANRKETEHMAMIIIPRKVNKIEVHELLKLRLLFHGKHRIFEQPHIRSVGEANHVNTHLYIAFTRGLSFKFMKSAES